MIEAVVFDAFGTLFDVHSATEACERFYPGKGVLIGRLWRQKQLEYTWLRSLMGRYVDFESVIREALRFTLGQLQLESSEEAIHNLAGRYRSLSPFPEVKEALKEFLPRKLLILSNGTGGMLRSLVQHAGISPHFSAILSVEPLKTYKPDPRVYQLAVDHLGMEKKKILFVSANGWDASGAKAFGLVAGWINRAGDFPEELGVTPDYTASNLLELARLVSEATKKPPLRDFPEERPS